jgi:Flp pilus assembly protein TadB
VKILLVPVAIIAFIVFLIVLGAIGLGIAFVLISIVRGIWRFVTRAESRRVRREARQAQQA